MTTLIAKYRARLAAHEGQSTYLTQVDDRELAAMLDFIESALLPLPVTRSDHRYPAGSLNSVARYGNANKGVPVRVLEGSNGGEIIVQFLADDPEREIPRGTVTRVAEILLLHG